MTHIITRQSEIYDRPALTMTHIITRQSEIYDRPALTVTHIITRQSEMTDCDDVDNGLDHTCEVIRQETVLFSTPETDYIIYD